MAFARTPLTTVLFLALFAGCWQNQSPKVRATPYGDAALALKTQELKYESGCTSQISSSVTHVEFDNTQYVRFRWFIGMDGKTREIGDFAVRPEEGESSGVVINLRTIKTVGTSGSTSLQVLPMAYAGPTTTVENNVETKHVELDADRTMTGTIVSKGELNIENDDTLMICVWEPTDQVGAFHTYLQRRDIAEVRSADIDRIVRDLKDHVFVFATVSESES